MISLTLPAQSEADRAFVARLVRKAEDARDAVLVSSDAAGAIYSGPSGLISIDGATEAELDGDVVLVQPDRIERLIRARSKHNTLLVTERCDQLCVMCSQPPKKTHVDRFELLEQACLLAGDGMVIGITGGEPTLYKDQLFGLVERVIEARPDLQFHVLTNAQHFEPEDITRLRTAAFRHVTWGVPLYASAADLHDEIVGKAGAFERLQRSFATLLSAGARIELRTVLLTKNATELSRLATFIGARLRFIEAWSIMQLENIGFARRRWRDLLFDHASDFSPVAEALNQAILHGVRAQLFNFPLCTVPAQYRAMAVASVSDWKRKLAGACATCRATDQCSGFFEWHPDDDSRRWAKPL
jgi:His-Xaa-Ser system radical SAM maturase HxsC